MSNILGVSAGFHDAALSVVNPDGDILFASHSERFSGKKHDKDLCDEIIYEALRYGQIDTISYYERPWLKNLRAVRAGSVVSKTTGTTAPGVTGRDSSKRRRVVIPTSAIRRAAPTRAAGAR